METKPHSVPPAERDSTIAMTHDFADDVISGAAQTEKYIPYLKGKNVACVVNGSSLVGKQHLVDTLLSRGIRIVTLFSPEHGIRSDADAGEQVASGIDARTGIPVISLYGSKKEPSPGDLQNVDILVYDLQDVGVRFYTYISTLHLLMDACAECHKPLLLLDRPDPNGFYVDGPVLESKDSSFVGMDPVPVVYGMTAGEYAGMLNGEHRLHNGEQCMLTVIPCLQYDHSTYYELPVPPSPNLKSMLAVYLYPSLCLFEGTAISVGRGTDKPFEIFGSPDSRKTSFFFTPESMPGAVSPVYLDRKCYGYDLSAMSINAVRNAHFDPEWLLEAYRTYNEPNNFFLPNGYFDKLAGTEQLRKQIEAGLSEEEIRMSWQEGLDQFKLIRKKYLLYPDFE